MTAAPSFTFVDLFAGIGGFHAALAPFGGQCVYAVEKDRAAAAVYNRNWGIDPLGDLTRDANRAVMRVPPHDVLVAGFPCQPFSKSGAQRGMSDARGSLYWNILEIVQAHRPEIVMLENVRNLAGRRHRHEWQAMIQALRDQGYWLSDTPSVFSPHRLPAWYGGRPQARDRVFITATRIPGGMYGPGLTGSPAALREPDLGWDPKSWRIVDWLDDDGPPGSELTPSDQRVVDAWGEFVDLMRDQLDGHRLPGFPMWADTWHDSYRTWPHPRGLPPWKHGYENQNRDFYAAFRHTIEPWAARWGVHTFPKAKRKLEWQAQDVTRLSDTVLQFRPSGIRCRPATYLPALVAMSQTSIIGARRRRISPREAARLQGLPESFNFGTQSDAVTFRQLGNGVNVGVVQAVLREHVRRDQQLLSHTPTGTTLVQAVLQAPLGFGAETRDGERWHFLCEAVGPRRTSR